MATEVIRDRKHWLEVKERIERNYSNTTDAEPDSYPCICCPSLRWHRDWGQHILDLDFVYASEFGATQAIAACKVVLNDLHNGEDGYWRAGPWADPKDPAGYEGIVQMLRDVVDQFGH